MGTIDNRFDERDDIDIENLEFCKESLVEVADPNENTTEKVIKKPKKSEYDPKSLDESSLLPVVEVK